MNKLVLIVFGWCVLGMPAQAASFDCAKADTNTEKLICENPVISKLDDELGKAYQEALSKANEEQKQRLVAEQKHWLKQTRNICTDESCFKQAYSSRLTVLTTFLAPKPPAQGGDWTYRGNSGRNELLCHDLLKRLNRYDGSESLDHRCSSEVIASYPKFYEAAWEDLDPRKYEELIVKLEKYSQEGPAGYFHLMPGLKEQQPDSAYRYRARDFIEHGGRLQMWRTRLVNHYGTGPIIPAPPGEQTIVRMGTPLPNNPQTKICIGKQKNISWGVVYVVTADLSGPDPNVDPGTFGILSSHRLAIYEGKPVLVGIEDIWRDGKLMLDRVCDFEFVKGEK